MYRGVVSVGWGHRLGPPWLQGFSRLICAAAFRPDEEFLCAAVFKEAAKPSRGHVNSGVCGSKQQFGRFLQSKQTKLQIGSRDAALISISAFRGIHGD